MSTEGTRQRTSESQCERQDTSIPTKCRIHSGDTGVSCQWLNSLTYLENKGYSVEESFVGWLLKNIFGEGGCSAWSSHSNSLYGGEKGLLSCAGLRGPGFRGIMWGVWACLLHLWDKSNWVRPLPKVAWGLTQLWSPERERLTGPSLWWQSQDGPGGFGLACTPRDYWGQACYWIPGGPDGRGLQERDES